MKHYQTLLQNIFLTSVTLLLVFVLVEISARVYLVNFASEATFKRYASLRQLKERYVQSQYSPHPYLGYYPTPNYQKGKNKHNSLGFKGEEIVLPKPETEFRIVALGGSTTYTTHVADYRLSYPALLEKELAARGYDHVKVINAGAGGYSSWETLVNFSFRVLDLDPDMIIIYHAVNDNTYRLVWPPEAYRGDNIGSKGFQQTMFMPSILEYSTVFRILMINLGLAASHNALDKVFPKTFYSQQLRTQIARGTYPEGIFREISAEKIIKTNYPVYFIRNLKNIIAMAKQHNIQVLLATFAHSPEANNLPGFEQFFWTFKEMNGIIKTIATENEVALFDFASKFPTDAAYFAGDPIHVNEKGVWLKAKLFADYITEEKLIPEKLSKTISVK